MLLSTYTATRAVDVPLSIFALPAARAATMRTRLSVEDPRQSTSASLSGSSTGRATARTRWWCTGSPRRSGRACSRRTLAARQGHTLVLTCELVARRVQLRITARLDDGAISAAELAELSAEVDAHRAANVGTPRVRTAFQIRVLVLEDVVPW